MRETTSFPLLALLLVGTVSLTSHEYSNNGMERYLASTSKSINLNELYDGKLKGSQDQNWAYYTLNLADQISQDLSYKDNKVDLVIQLSQKGTVFTDSSLFINLNSELPNLNQFSMQCSFFGEDFCVINGKELEMTSLITIGVFCREQCEYELQGELTEELVFQPNKFQKLYFKENQERIIKFTIPNDENITTIEISGVNQNKFDKFNMIMANNNQMPNSDNSLYLRPAWENGYVGKFTENCFCFCRGCNYTVLISSDKEGYITVGAKVHGYTVDITSSEGVIYDSVLNFQAQCYSYQVRFADKDLRIKLESYAGDPDVYINPIWIPPQLSESAFNSRDHFQNEELILTPAERLRANAVTGQYYICVWGQQASTYKIQVLNENHDVFLVSGLSQSGYVMPNETSIHYFRDPLLADPSISIEISMHIMIGKARLKSKLCQIEAGAPLSSFKDSCTYTFEDLFQEDPDEKLIQDHIGSESVKNDVNICKMEKPNNKRAPEVTCVWVIGIIGLAEYETHFSVLVKTNKPEEHTKLRQGVPFQSEIKENDPNYFSIHINDPKVKRLIIQLTTIHGDPDIFVSRFTKTPSYWEFEGRSIRCGMYPEIIQYIKDENNEAFKTLVGDFYVNVFSYTQSTYSLVYYVETDEGVISAVQLLMGQKQKGVLKTTQESLVYEFELVNSMKEEVEIRLISENGQFNYYLGRGFIPDEKSYTTKGTEINQIVFESQNETADLKTTYYVRVVPYQASVLIEDQIKDSAGMAYVYTIAYYEQGSFIHLSYGVPMRGQVNNDSLHYFYVDIQGKSDYEITLTAISGNPDLGISLDSRMKFPDRFQNTFVSQNVLIPDTVIITQDQIKQFESENGIKATQIFISIFTNDTKASTYTIMTNKKDAFNPVLLTNGQSQSGTIDAGESKFYYFKTGSDMPLYASLIPKKGNPDLSISIIKNFSESRYSWQKYADLPYFKSKVQFGADIIYLNTNNTLFKDGCGASCILLIQVTNANKDSEAYYRLSMTRDILELIENTQIQDSIQEVSMYKYYRFYKSCEECEIDITITPLQSSSTMLLMADFEVKSRLPTHQSNPKWYLNAFQQSTLKITPNSTIINNAKKTNTQIPIELSSIGMYTIGVHSHQNASFLLSVQIIDLANSNQEDALTIRKVFLGETQDIDLNSREIKYLYFENWVNASIRLQFLPIQDSPSKINNLEFDFRVTTMESRKQVPKHDSDLIYKKWKTNRVKTSIDLQNQKTDTLEIGNNDPDVDFCVQCFFIIRIENLKKEKQQNGRLIITQDNEHGGLGFKSNLIVGRPYVLKLRQYQQTQFNFLLNYGFQAELDVQYFTGNADYEIKDWTDNSIFFPSIGNQDQELLEFTETKSSIKAVLKQLVAGRVYQLIVIARQDLHASILLSQDNDLTVVSDGVTKSVYFSSKSSMESKYFLYLPPSPKFQLAVSAATNTFDVYYYVSIKQINTRGEISQKDKIQSATANGQSGNKRDLLFGIKKKNKKDEVVDTLKSILPQMSDLSDNSTLSSNKGGSASNDLLTMDISNIENSLMGLMFWRNFKNAKNFDFTLKSTNTKGGMALFDVFPIELAHEDNLLLIKVDIIKGYNDTADVQLTLSGSEIQLLLPGTTVKGHVSNWNQTYKIYEIYVNQNQLFNNENTDLYIQVTPCSGKVDFYVSENYLTLFNRDKQVSSIDLKSNEKFGMESARVRNIKGKEVLYVGIQSSNEFYQDLKQKVDSYFEIRTELIRNSQDDIMDSYMFKDSTNELEVKFDEKDPDNVIVNWSKIFYKQNQDSFIGSSSKFSAAKDVQYQLYAGTKDHARYSMNSQCAIEHSEMYDIFTIFMNPEDMQTSNQIRLQRQDIESIKVLGLIAKVKDPVTGQVINLAYEPLNFNPDNFGVKVQMAHLAIFAVVSIIVVVLLILIICCLRKKSLIMAKRLQSEQYAQQNFSTVGIENPNLTKDDSRDEI